MWVSRIGLTHSMLVIHPSFTQSKWNMGEICGLKFHLFHAYTSHFFIIEIPPCARNVIFITEFAILSKSPPFYFIRKWLAHEEISKIFFLDHFLSSFLAQTYQF